jgi:hypothetical protein
MPAPTIPGVVTGTHGENVDAINIEEIPLFQIQAAELGGAEVLQQASALAHGAAHRVGLLHNFLDEEMLVLALHGLGGFDIHLFDGFLDFLLMPVHRLIFPGTYDRHLPVVQEDGLAGKADKGSGVACKDHLLLADADDQRAAVAGADEQFAVVLEQYDDAVGTFDAVQSGADRLFWSAGSVEVIIDQMSKDFRIGFAFELIALILKLTTQVDKIVDDAVVNHRHLSVSAEVGMGVLI